MTDCCSVCGKFFDKNGDCASHTNGRQCLVCGSTFKYARTAKEHVRKHTGAKPYKCTHPGCKARLQSQTTLRRHVMLSHVQPLRKKSVSSLTMTVTLGCPVPSCAMRFLSAASLRTHLSTMRHRALTVQTTHCTVCKLAFDPETHECDAHFGPVTATGERSCGLCSLTHIKSATVREHIRRHTGARPAQCSECIAAFTTARELKDHTRVHHKSRVQFLCPEPGCLELAEFPTATELGCHWFEAHGQGSQDMCNKCRGLGVAHAGLHCEVCTAAFGPSAITVKLTELEAALAADPRARMFARFVPVPDPAKPWCTDVPVFVAVDAMCAYVLHVEPELSSARIEALFDALDRRINICAMTLIPAQVDVATHVSAALRCIRAPMRLPGLTILVGDRLVNTDVGCMWQYTMSKTALADMCTVL